MPSLYGEGLWGKSLYSQSIAATGALALTQAPQTFVGAASSFVGGILAVSQDDQVLAATGIVEQPPISAALVVTQDAHVLSSKVLILGWGPSEPCPLSPWDEAEACPPSMWTPTPPPNWELPGVTQGWGVGAYGVSVYQPSSSSPWLPPDDQSATPPTWTPSAPPVSVDWQETEPCDG